MAIGLIGPDERPQQQAALGRRGVDGGTVATQALGHRVARADRRRQVRVGLAVVRAERDGGAGVAP